MKWIVPLGCSLFLWVSCATTIPIRRVTIPTHDLGAVRRLSLVEISGQQQGEAVIEEWLKKKTAEMGYFDFQDLRAEFTGKSLNIELPKRKRVDPSVAELWMFVKVHNWDLRELYGPEDMKTRGFVGKEQEKSIVKRNVVITVEFQLMDPEMGTVVFDKQYETSRNWSLAIHEVTSFSQSNAVKEEAGTVVESFLKEITPPTIEEKLELDTEISGLSQGFQWAQERKYDLALQFFNEKASLDAQCYCCFYNAGVMAASQGDYRQARKNFEMAYQLNSKELYKNALDWLSKVEKDQIWLRGKSSQDRGTAATDAR